jgi:small-conductance mechanosensitive channel
LGVCLTNFAIYVVFKNSGAVWIDFTETFLAAFLTLVTLLVLFASLSLNNILEFCVGVVMNLDAIPVHAFSLFIGVFLGAVIIGIAHLALKGEFLMVFVLTAM